MAAARNARERIVLRIVPYAYHMASLPSRYHHARPTIPSQGPGSDNATPWQHLCQSEAASIGLYWLREDIDMTALAVSERLLTPEEFYELEDSVAYELDDGILEERAVSRQSSEIGAILIIEAGGVVRRQRLGKAYGADMALQFFPGRPRRIPRADFVFVSNERLGAAEPDAPYLTVAPELLAEVVSPSERAAKTDRKVQEYIEAGVRLVWVVYPETQRVMVYRADGSTQLVPFESALDGEDVLPGFRLPLSELFPAETSVAPVAE